MLSYDSYCTMPKERVTITLRPDVRTVLDAERGDVNRSRAVERYLCRCLKLPLTLEKNGGDS